MASKKEKKIINKIRILLTQSFTNPEDAFAFFDKNEDGVLDKNEVKSLLKEAKVGGFIRGLVAKKLIEKFDESKEKTIDWKEFQQAIIDIFQDSNSKTKSS